MAILLQLIVLIIMVLSLINLFRMTLLLIGSDLYNLVIYKKFRSKSSDFFPKISVVIPAFNEEVHIIRSLSSVFEASYPSEQLEVIVVDDGSKDATYSLAINYKHQFSKTNLKIITQPNLGKAQALNNGMRNYATGDLVMCLDADSYLEKNALQKIVRYFQDEQVVAVAANVKVTKDKGILNMIQRFEYLVSYQMKRAQTFFNIEYIIGGIGSTFRKSHLDKIGYYDTNTVTEDIDLTMKLLRAGNKNVKVMYASDAICFTEGVLNIRDLIRQRSRWKWGRAQTFLKNKSMFFSRDKGFTRSFSWFYLPFAIWNDIVFLLEPIIITFIITISIVYRDPVTLLASLTVLTIYMIVNILAEDTISFRVKLAMILIAPSIYFLFYILSYVEYIALIKAIAKLPTLKDSLSTSISHWKPVERSGYLATYSKINK